LFVSRNNSHATTASKGKKQIVFTESSTSGV